MTTKLFHFSEDPAIDMFEPRAVPGTRPIGREWLNAPLVWAIDGWHSPAYLFPRDCPRILWWPLPTTTSDDIARYIGTGSPPMVACVEWAWFERIATTTLFRYSFETTGFIDVRDHGVHVSRDAAVPAAVAPIRDLPAAPRAAAVELRFMPSLVPLRGMWDTTLHVSGIRLRNAEGWD